MMQKFELYSTKLFYKNVLNSKYNDFLITISHNLMNIQGKTDTASVRNGWQSDLSIYNMKEFSPLCDYILKETSLNLLYDRKIKPYITSMWLNVHNQHGFNHAHVHSGSWYSGIYYINCTEKTGNITFLDPRPGAENNFYHNYIENNLLTIKPIVGDLILFPSWLPHLVEPNDDTEKRISIAFNIELDI
jgi:uncharacterized protein (TIGR02466 family)